MAARRRHVVVGARRSPRRRRTCAFTIGGYLEGGREGPCGGESDELETRGLERRPHPRQAQVRTHTISYTTQTDTSKGSDPVPRQAKLIATSTPRPLCVCKVCGRYLVLVALRAAAVVWLRAVDRDEAMTGSH